MMIHTVLFWMKDGASDADVQALRQGLETLQRIKAPEAVYIGTPAETKRPVIDRSYTFCLTVVLPGMEAHDAYQEDPIHLAFVDNCARLWDRVLIYDAD